MEDILFLESTLGQCAEEHLSTSGAVPILLIVFHQSGHTE